MHHAFIAFPFNFVDGIQERIKHGILEIFDQFNRFVVNFLDASAEEQVNVVGDVGEVGAQIVRVPQCLLFDHFVAFVDAAGKAFTNWVKLILIRINP